MHKTRPKRSKSQGKKAKGLVAQLCPTLYDPMTIAHQAPLPMELILQVRTLEWVAIPFSRGSSQPRDQT